MSMFAVVLLLQAAVAPAHAEDSHIEQLAALKADASARLSRTTLAMPEVEAIILDAGLEGCRAWYPLHKTAVDKAYGAFRPLALATWRPMLTAREWGEERHPVGLAQSKLTYRAAAVAERLDRDAAPVTAAAAGEVRVALQRWFDVSGYKGRRLGYRPDGQPIWHRDNPGALALTCFHAIALDTPVRKN